MESLTAVLTKVEELSISEGDMLMIMGHLKTVYEALPKELKTVDKDTPALFQPPRREIDEIADAEGLWRPDAFIRDIDNPALLLFAKAFYDFFTTAEMTVEDLSARLDVPYPMPKQPNETWTPRQRIDFIIQKESLNYHLVYITERLSPECAETIQNIIDHNGKGFDESLGIIVKARAMISMAWKRNLQVMLKDSVSADGLFNQQTHFRKGLVALSNVDDDIPHHTVKIDIDLTHPLFLGNHSQERGNPVYETLTLATSYIKLGGHTGSVKQIYNWIGFRALLGNGATSQMIKLMKKNYNAHDGWRMSVSGITAKTRNKIRTYDCGFAVAQYASKLNNGELKISASKK